jgi:hypothetical protein
VSDKKKPKCPKCKDKGYIEIRNWQGGWFSRGWRCDCPKGRSGR